MNGLGAKVYVSSNDLQQYNELTLSRGFQSSIAPELHFGLGKYEKATVKVIWPNGAISEMKDVLANQNIEIDILTANTSKEVIEAPKMVFETMALDSMNVDFKHTENNYNDYFFEPLLPHQTSMLGPGVAVADVNADGLDDFYIGGALKQSGALYVQNAEGQFYKTNDDIWEADKDKEDMSALFFDVDNDGDSDLYVVSGGNEKSKELSKFQDRLYINDGKGRFSKSEDGLPTITTSGSRIVTGDYDADGDLDVFVGGRLVPGQYPWPTKSYILQNNHGVFKDVTSQIAKDFDTLGMITDACWTDFDGNGTLDLIIVGEWTPILFYSNKNGVFENVTETNGMINTNGWWSSITQDDFDNDGDMDYVVGNLGLNYKYKASPEEPFEVHADDFDQNNRKDIVLSYYNFGKLFPVRGKSCSSQQIPSLKNKFKDYNSFSVAGLTDVYGKEALNNAEIHYKAQNFASSYVENLGNGQFKLTPLPNEAQFSSVNKIISEDIDKDGYKDIIIGGNLYASEIETPRNDSGIGLYLKGDGQGHFIPVSSMESNLYINGDVKDFASITIGNAKSMIVVKNNDYPQFVKVKH